MPRLRPIPQYSDSKLGVSISSRGELVNADVPPTVILSDYDSGEVLFPSEQSTQEGTGLYVVHIPYDLTTELRKVRATWNYSVDGNERVFEEGWQVYGPMETWNGLRDSEKVLVDGIYDRVANAFDSREGGPYLWEVWQSHFNPYEVAAQSLGWGAEWLNYYGQPVFSWQIGNEAQSPYPEKHMGLLERIAYWEFLKHLSRSYIEIPDAPGVTVARLDRRRYRDEWAKEAKAEEDLLLPLVRMLKRAYLFRNRSLLVAGGAFPVKLFNTTRPMWLYVPLRYA